MSRFSVTYGFLLSNIFYTFDKPTKFIMGRYYATRADYLLDLKFEHFEKKFREAVTLLYYVGETPTNDKAKKLVYILWPEYKELFGTVEFQIY